MKNDEHILCVDKVVLIETIDYMCPLEIRPSEGCTDFPAHLQQAK